MGKICPKCGVTHEKNGTFCSRTCANSRGPRTDEFKKTVSAKLKGRPNPRKGTRNRTRKCTIKYSSITGKIMNSDYWSYNIRARFLTKVSNWFNVPLCQPETSELFEVVKQQLHELYNVQRMSSLEIKEHLKIPLPNGHMPAFLKQMGIKRRSPSDAAKNAILTGRLVLPKNGVRYINGWHEDFESYQHYYRSSYELKFYKKLDEKRIPYKTEELKVEYFDTVQQKRRVAIPDVLIRDNVIFEIKSSYRWGLEKQNIVDKFDEYKNQGYRPYLVVDGELWWQLRK